MGPFIRAAIEFAGLSHESEVRPYVIVHTVGMPLRHSQYYYSIAYAQLTFTSPQLSFLTQQVR